MKTKLKNIVDSFIVPQRDKPKVFNGEIPWCRIEDIEGKYLAKSLTDKNVSESTIQEMNLKVFPIGTIIFSCSATIGVSAITTAPLCTNQTFIGIVTSKNIDTEYLYYYLSCIGSDLKKSATITTIAYLSKGFFENLEIEVPQSLHSQKLISSSLKVIDEKIQINKNINHQLSELQRLIYNYWFIQLDFPNNEGKPYKSSGGKMVYSNELKREIPEGWKTELITKSCSIVDCLHSKKPDQSKDTENKFLLQLNNIKDDGLIDLSSKYFVKHHDYLEWTKRIEVEDGDVIITNAGRVAATAQVPKGLRTGIGRNITAIRPHSVSPTYLYLSFRGEDFRRQIKWNTDTGSFFKSLNVKGIKKLYLLIPPKELEQTFESIVLPLRRKRENNQIANEKLEEIKNRLLPMLMNGQVTIKD